MENDIRHQALLTVLGEMWHEMQKVRGKHRVLSLDLFEHPFTHFRSRVTYEDHGAEMTLLSKAVPFQDIPEVLETTMLFREITADRKDRL